MFVPLEVTSVRYTLTLASFRPCVMTTARSATMERVSAKRESRRAAASTAFDPQLARRDRPVTELLALRVPRAHRLDEAVAETADLARRTQVLKSRPG